MFVNVITALKVINKTYTLLNIYNYINKLFITRITQIT